MCNNSHRCGCKTTPIARHTIVHACVNLPVVVFTILFWNCGLIKELPVILQRGGVALVQTCLHQLAKHYLRHLGTSYFILFSDDSISLKSKNISLLDIYELPFLERLSSSWRVHSCVSHAHVLLTMV